MYGNFNVERVNSLNQQMRNDAIAANSLNCSSGDLIRIDGSGLAQLAGVGERINGVALNNVIFASDNQTVAMQRVDMITMSVNLDSRKAPMYEGTITEANIGDFFDITATQEVDAATASTTTGVVKLIKVLSPTVGEFVFTGQGS